MFEDAATDTDQGREDRPSRAPWFAAALLALVAVAATAWLAFFALDRERARDELEDARRRIGRLEAEVEGLRSVRATLEAQVAETSGTTSGALEAREACRTSTAEALEMWNDLVGALNAAAEPDPETFEEFARRAERSRDRVVDALAECEEASSV